MSTSPGDVAAGTAPRRRGRPRPARQRCAGPATGGDLVSRTVTGGTPLGHTHGMGDGEFANVTILACVIRGRRRRAQPGHRIEHRGGGGVCRAGVDRLPAPQPANHLAGAPQRGLRSPVQAAAVGCAARGDVHRHDRLRAVRFHLGRQPAHRQWPRPRSARQSGALLHHRRAVRNLRRGHGGRGAALRKTGSGSGTDHPRLVRAGRWRLNGRLRPVRADRFPARRRVAPDLRPGRHPVGAHSPDDDRRRRIRNTHRVVIGARGTPSNRCWRAGRRDRPEVHPVLGLCRCGHRNVGVPDRIRFRGVAIPARAPADAHRRRRDIRVGARANDAWARRGDCRGAGGDRPARRGGADGRTDPRRTDQLVPAVSRPGICRRDHRAHPIDQAAHAVRRSQWVGRRHGGPVVGVTVDRQRLPLSVADEHVARGAGNGGTRGVPSSGSAQRWWAWYSRDSGCRAEPSASVSSSPLCSSPAARWPMVCNSTCPRMPSRRSNSPRCRTSTATRWFMPTCGSTRQT